MGGITLNDIGEALKLIVAIISGVGTLGGIFIFALKNYTKPIMDKLNTMDVKMSTQQNDIDDIKIKMNSLTIKYDELDRKSTSNRELDSLLVKTLRMLLDDNNPRQQAIKDELDNFIINEAIR